MTTVEGMEKADGAFLTIGELAKQLGVAQHILRYWESRFPQLRPLQRAGNRRYYRPQDVEVAQHIHRLLNVEGFTIKGAVKALASRGGNREGRAEHPLSVAPAAAPSVAVPPMAGTAVMEPPVPAMPRAAAPHIFSADGLLDRLQSIRGTLSDALGSDALDDRGGGSSGS